MRDFEDQNQGQDQASSDQPVKASIYIYSISIAKCTYIYILCELGRENNCGQCFAIFYVRVIFVPYSTSHFSLQNHYLSVFYLQVIVFYSIC